MTESAGQKFTGVAQTSGAMLTVLVALAITFVLSLVAILKCSEEDVATVAGAAFTAIGTLAGGYAGVRIGAHGKEEADQTAQEANLVLERVAEAGSEDQVSTARAQVRQELEELAGRRST